MTEVTPTKSIVYNLRIDADTYGHIKKLSEREEIPLSFVIRRALKRGLGLPVLAKEQERVTMPDWE